MIGTINKLPKKVINFFNRMENYLETDLLFYGSVTRDDYVHGKSNIDVAIFTDNEYSILSKLQHFLDISQNNIDKIVCKLNGTMIYGYKIKLPDINGEISIYNNDFKDILLEEYNRPIKHKTIITSILIYILKILHYEFQIIPSKLYKKCKRYILNDMMFQKQSTFLLLKQNKDIIDTI